jgi:putative oxidoreductase
MNVIQQFQTRVGHWPSPILFLLRVALGCMLMIKGIGFISHIQALEAILAESHFQNLSQFLIYYIPYAHMLGGLFILLGLWTRFFSLIQLPVLFGAVFLINVPHATFQVQAGELGFSIVVLLLLIFFSIEGNGPYSISRFVHTHAV